MSKADGCLRVVVNGIEIEFSDLVAICSMHSKECGKFRNYLETKGRVISS